MNAKQFLFVFAVLLATVFAADIVCDNSNCKINTSKCVALQTMPTGSDAADYVCEIEFEYTVAEDIPNITIDDITLDFSIKGGYSTPSAEDWATQVPDYPRPAYWVGYHADYPTKAFKEDALPSSDGSNTTITIIYKTYVMRGAHICINPSYLEAKYRLADISFGVKHSGTEVNNYKYQTALWSTGDISPQNSSIEVLYDNRDLDAPDVKNGDQLQIVDGVPMQFKVELRNPIPTGDKGFQITDANWFIGSIISDYFGDDSETSTASTSAITVQSEEVEDESAGLDKFVEMIKFELYTCLNPDDLANYATNPSTAGCTTLFSMKDGSFDPPACADIVAAFDAQDLADWFGAGFSCSNADADTVISDKLSAIKIEASIPTEFSINPPYAVIPVTISKIPGNLNIGFSLRMQDPLSAGNTLSIADMKIAITSAANGADNMPSVTSKVLKYTPSVSALPYFEYTIDAPMMFTHLSSEDSSINNGDGTKFACSKIMKDEIGDNTHLGGNTCQFIVDTSDADEANHTTTIRILPSYQGTPGAFPLLAFIENADTAFRGISDRLSGQSDLDYMFVQGNSNEKRTLKWNGSGNGVLINRTVTGSGDSAVINDKPLFLGEGLDYSSVVPFTDALSTIIDSSVTDWIDTIGDVPAPSVSIETGEYSHIKFTFDSLPESVLANPLAKVPITLYTKKVEGSETTYSTVKNFYSPVRKAFKSNVTLESSNFEVVDGKYVLHAFSNDDLDAERVDFIFLHPLLKIDTLVNTGFTFTKFNGAAQVDCTSVHDNVLEINPVFRARCSLPNRTPNFKVKNYKVTVDGMSVTPTITIAGNFCYVTVTGDDALKLFTSKDEGNKTVSFTLNADDVTKTVSVPVYYVPETAKVVELKSFMFDGRYRITTYPATVGSLTVDGSVTEGKTAVEGDLSECKTLVAQFSADGYDNASKSFDVMPKTLYGETTPVTFKVFGKDGNEIAADAAIKAREQIEVEITMPFASYGTHVAGLAGCSAEYKALLQQKTFYVYRVVVEDDAGEVLVSAKITNSSSDKPRVNLTIPSIDVTDISIKVEVSTQYRYMGVKTVSEDFTLTAADPITPAAFNEEFDNLLSSGNTAGFTAADVLSLVTAVATSAANAEEKKKMQEKKAALIASSSNDLDVEDTARAVNELFKDSDNNTNLNAVHMQNIRNSMADQLSKTASVDFSTDTTGEAAERVKQIAKNAQNIPKSFDKLYQAGQGASTQAIASELEGSDITGYAHTGSYVDPMNNTNSVVALGSSVSSTDACEATPTLAVTADATMSREVVISKYNTDATATGLGHVKMPGSFFSAAKSLLTSGACISTSSVATPKPSASEIYARTTLFNGDGEVEYGYLKSNVVTVGFSNSDNVLMSDIFANTVGNIDITLDKVSGAKGLKCMARLSTGSWATNGCSIKSETDSEVVCTCPVSRAVRSSTTALAAFSSVPGLESSNPEGTIGDAFGGSLGVLTLGCIGGALVLGILGMVCGARSSKKATEKKNKKVSPV